VLLKKKDRSKKRVVSGYVKEGLHEKIQKLADFNDMSRSEVVSNLLEKALDAYKFTSKAKKA